MVIHDKMADNQKLVFNNKGDEINILLACTGSVASIKVPLLVEKLQGIKILKKDLLQRATSTSTIVTDIDTYIVNVRLVTTEHAKHFYTPENVSAIIYEDKDEWATWKKRTDPVLHIELRRWADTMVVAPLDANTLAKLANGLCDNLLTCVARAWDFQKPLIFAPAMNTYMWDHPFTKKHTQCLKDIGLEEITCIEKTLICGDKGMGAMADIDTIVQYVSQRLCESKSSISVG